MKRTESGRFTLTQMLSFISERLETYRSKMIHPKKFTQAVRCTFPVVLAFLALSVSLPAQGTGKPSIGVADVAADTAHQIVVPIEVSNLEDVVRMEFKIQFPSNVLDFLEVRSPMSQDGLVAHAHLEADGESGNVSVLSIEVESTEPIGTGSPVEMVFDPSDEIFENQFFFVSILEASLGTAGGEEIEDLDTKDGNVVVIIPLFSCFFFMH